MILYICYSLDRKQYETHYMPICGKVVVKAIYHYQQSGISRIASSCLNTPFSLDSFRTIGLLS